MLGVGDVLLVLIRESLEESSKAANFGKRIVSLSISKACFKGGKAGETPRLANVGGQLGGQHQFEQLRVGLESRVIACVVEEVR